MYKMNISFYIPVLILLMGITGCNKLVEVPPPTKKLTGVTMYNGDGTAASVLTGLYTLMSKSQFSTGAISLNAHAGVLADELNYAPVYGNAQAIQPSYINQLFATEYSDYCETFYPFIYTVNLAIENLTISTKLTPQVKQHLLGEAKFSRAFCYFYLVNLYGEIPFPLISDYNKNSLLAKSSVADVYNQIISDLKDAQELLTDDYLQADGMAVSSERFRPNKGAATALLARVYLYTGDWAKSEEEASLLINDVARYHLESLNDVFLKTSSEAIWQLQVINLVSATDEAAMFVIPEGPNFYQPFYLSDFLLQAFEPGDQRKVDWVNSASQNGVTYYYPFKYKINANSTIHTPEASTVLRLAEQYLIRAEARAHQENIEGAQEDLNVIRNRSGLDNTTATTSADLITAILHEKQVELFTEFGHRWFDLKRSHTIDSVMNIVTPAKGGQSWKSYQQLLPFSIILLKADAALVQNEGY